VDWTGCKLVEVIPGKVSGAPLVVGTRIPADLVVDLFESGYPMSEILADYPSLTREIVEGVLFFSHTRETQAVR
jgi:uncharacterized protein (DUF433 family)